MLKRQSMARAKAMYNPRQSHAQPTQNRRDTLARRTLRRATVAPRKSVFLPRTPATPRIQDRPLPLPPVLYKPLEQSIEDLVVDGTEQSKRQQVKSLSVTAVLATLWPNLDKKRRTKLILGFCAAILHSGSMPLFSYILIHFFDTFAMTSGYQKKVLTYSAAIIGIAAVDGFACFFMQYLLDSASQEWVDYLREEALEHILQQPKRWFDDESNSATLLVSALDKNAEEVRGLVEQYAAQILVIVAMMLLALTWAFITCWKLTLVSVAASPILYGLAKCFEVVSIRMALRAHSAADNINEVFTETFSDIRTVRSFTLEAYFHQKYDVAIKQAFTVGLLRAFYNALFYGLSDSAIAFFTPMMFGYGAYLAKNQEWSANSIFTVFGLLLFCTAKANATISFMPQTASAVETASRLIRLAHMPTHSHESMGDMVLQRDDPMTLAGPIHFINLTFAYPTRPSVPALRQLNLTIMPGKITAIVGSSGSGKSTITSLLLGLYPPRPSDPFNDDTPSLTLSGRDICTLDLPTLRSLIALVPQAPILLSTTVRDNITYGLAANSPYTTPSSIEAAAVAAGIHDFILTLPQGYATLIGDEHLSVSGGQAQRIVIARALIRDPKILILDEATSALDHESARLIRHNVVKLKEKRRREGRVLTVVVITHAREMMEFADRIVVLEKGSVVDEGAFTELLGKGRSGNLWGLVHGDGGEEG